MTKLYDPYRVTKMKAHTPHGVGFFIPETPVFIGDSLGIVGKRRKMIYLRRCSKKVKTTPKTTPK